MPRNAGLSPGVELVGHARVHSEGPDLFLFRVADRLAQIGAAIICGFSLLVCYLRSREIRRGIQAKRCSRASSLMATPGLAVAAGDRFACKLFVPGITDQE